MKMKTILGFALGMTLCMDVFSQPVAIDDGKVMFLRNRVRTYVEEMRMEVTQDSNASRLLSKDAFRQYMRQHFTLINYDRETFTEGNSAALKISDDKTSLNLALSHQRNGLIVTVGTALNIKDNSGTLFTGSTPTTGTQFNINFSGLFSSFVKKPFFWAQKIYYDDDVRLLNYSVRRALADSLNTVYVLRNPNLIGPLRRRLIVQDSTIRSNLSQLAHARSQGLDTIRIQTILTTAIDEREKVMTEIKKLPYSGGGPELFEKLKKETDQKRINKEIGTEGVTVFQMLWGSIGGSYRRDNYKTYDTLRAVSKRAGEQPFDGWSLVLGTHYYFQRTPMWIAFSGNRVFNSIYFGLTYSMAGSNSFAGLDENNYSVIKAATSKDTVFQISTSDKLRNTTGKEFSRFLVHKVGVQFTGMIGTKQFFGLNVSGSIESSSPKGTTYNSRLGLLFRFIDSADQKSKVNFEVFLALDDFENVNKSKVSAVWDRRQIGISASVPFRKVFFK